MTGITKRNDSYRFTVYQGYTANGKQIRKTMTYKALSGLTPKQEAKAVQLAYLEFKNKCEGGSNSSENMRFKELASLYFDVYARNELKEITSYNYKKLSDMHLLPMLGNKRIKDLSTSYITAYLTSLDVSPVTCKKLHTILSSIFKYANRMQFISSNPCHNVVLPKIEKSDKKRYLEQSDIHDFLNYFNDNDTLSIVVKLLLYTGMRGGEALALTWSNIDFNSNTISIRGTLSDVGGKHFITAPKTKTSNRVLYMSDTVKELLQMHKANQLFNSDMVFTSSSGNYKDRSCLNTSFRRRLKGSKYEYMTLHMLRHTNATLLLNNGTDLKVISEHLGHSDVNITASVYTDVLASTKIKTANILNNLIQ